MTIHLNSEASKAPRLKAPPTTAEIKTARLANRLTQREAGVLVYAAMRTWQDWERGVHAMPLATWALFLLMTAEAV